MNTAQEAALWIILGLCLADVITSARIYHYVTQIFNIAGTCS